MAQFKIKKAPLIDTEIQVPGDKSMSHRAVLFASMSNGTCVIRGFLPSEDCQCTLEAMRTLGVEIEQPEPTTLIIHGCHGKFTAPSKAIYCGNSGTTMRLLAGLLVAQPFTSRLTGDPALSHRPMKRIVTPLAQMGADIVCEGENGCAPLLINGKVLTPTHYNSPIASAQVKSAILLAGLQTKGRTSITEPAQSRDHTERMLQYFLVTVQQEELTNIVYGGQTPESRDFIVPGDISSAAFWLIAAAIQPKSRLIVTDVGLNKTRSGMLAVLVRMGAKVREIVEDLDQIEPMGSIEIRGANLIGTVIEGAEIPNVIDEIPALAVAAALATGTTTIRNARELRVKECDRINATVTNLRAMGANVEELDEGMIIHGSGKLRGARLDSFGDHRIAMAFAIAGLFADGETIIDNAECVDISYPGFEDALRHIMNPKSKKYMLSKKAEEPDT